MAWSCTQKRRWLDWVDPAVCSCCLNQAGVQITGAILDPSDGAIVELTVYIAPRCSHGVRGGGRGSQDQGGTEETPRYSGQGADLGDTVGLFP